MARKYPMTVEEIVTSYRQAKNPQLQIGVLADLNVCTRKEIKDLLESALALAELTPTQLRRFQLFAENGKSFREIAKIEQCEYSAVRKSVNQAIEKMKKFLKRGCSKRDFLSD